MTTYDYVNTTILGASRPMTKTERNRLLKAKEAFSRTPKTPEAKKANQDARRLVAELYENAVSRREISEVTGWSIGSISQLLRTARREGIATGQRVYIQPPSTIEKPPAPPRSRELTKRERTWLTTAAKRLPIDKRGCFRWDNMVGDDIISHVAVWRNDTPPVSLTEIAETLNMSRQAVSVMIDRYVDRQRPEARQVKGLTDEQFTALNDALNESRQWGVNRVKWTSPESRNLARVLGDLYEDGISLKTLARALQMPVPAVRNGIHRSGAALLPKDLPPQQPTVTVTYQPAPLTKKTRKAPSPA